MHLFNRKKMNFWAAVASLLGFPSRLARAPLAEVTVLSRTQGVSVTLLPTGPQPIHLHIFVKKRTSRPISWAILRSDLLVTF
jgi:hypothetical protein